MFFKLFVLSYLLEGDESREGNDLQDSIVTPHSFDSVRLSHFLQRASQVTVLVQSQSDCK